MTLFELEFGRGTRELRGLVAPIARCIFSPDGKLFAAIAHDWQMGIWNAETGRLLHLLKSPHGAWQTDPFGREERSGSLRALCSVRDEAVAEVWKLVGNK